MNRTLVVPTHGIDYDHPRWLEETIRSPDGAAALSQDTVSCWPPGAPPLPPWEGEAKTGLQRGLLIWPCTPMAVPGCPWGVPVVSLVVSPVCLVVSVVCSWGVSVPCYKWDAPAGCFGGGARADAG